MAALLDALVTTFLPARCVRCLGDLPAGSRAGVCAACWNEVRPHPAAGCPSCGDPDASAGGPCLACRTAPPAWSAAASWGPYLGALRDLVLLFKSAGRDELDIPLAALLAEAFNTAGWPIPDAVTAAPMTLARRLRRGYNQAELLGRALADTIGSRYRPLLRRTSARRQTGRSRAERLALPAGAFAARGSIPPAILLVDDVFTTGATMAGCTRALLHAGAAGVHVLTLAHTPHKGRIP